MACIVLVLSVTESTCLSSAISKSSAMPSLVFCLIAPIILLTSSICFARLSSLSLMLFKLRSTTFLTYLDKIPAASSLSICSFSTLKLSVSSFRQCFIKFFVDRVFVQSCFHNKPHKCIIKLILSQGVFC